jgi:carboxypeptidase Taq
MPASTAPYVALEARLKRLADLGGAAAVLNWDQAAVMPKGGNVARGEQLAALGGLIHELLVADATAELIEAARAEPLDAWQAANLALIERRYNRATALPQQLVEARARATNACEMAWRQARADDDFPALRPQLEEVLRLTREAAALEGAKLGLDPYAALLDQFQPGLDEATIDRLFQPLEARLPAMIDAVIARQGAPLEPVGPFPAERQKALAKELMTRLGFDFAHGRLDESTHPFCGGTPTDIRITTRYDEREVVSALMGVLHETGHALYEAGLPELWRGQPVGESHGMAIHESQSLIIEMQACRSPAFLRFLEGLLVATFGAQPAFAADNLIRLYGRVEKGFIRVDADELTYPLHIVLRYRLEKALIAGDLVLRDLPAAWNDGMRDLLGIVPPDDRQGCLQDIHWPVGAFGYFPNYTLGALLAAQLFQAALRALPGLMGAIEAGDFAPLRDWLRQHVHARASSLPMPELVEAATGQPLGTDAFLAHVEGRYGVA